MNKSQMININEEYFNSPYYFLIREKTDKYSLYFSINGTLSEARDNDEVVHFDKKNIKKIKNHLNKIVKTKRKPTTKKLKKELESLMLTLNHHQQQVPQVPSLISFLMYFFHS